MTTYYAAGSAGSAGLIEHLMAEIAWLRTTVDRLSRRADVAVADALPADNVTAFELGRAAERNLATATAAPVEASVDGAMARRTGDGVDAEVIDLAERLNRRIASRAHE